MKKAVLILLVSFLVSCGYHFAGQGRRLPGGITKIAVPEIINQSAEPLVDNLLASRISEELGRNARISEVKESSAEAILRVVIRRYSSQALSYDSEDDIAEFRSEITIDANLASSGDLQPLWHDNISWTAEYVATDNKFAQEDNERRAIEEICKRLAEELVFRLYQAE